MKLSQAKEYLPLVQAAAEGKTIQMNCSQGWVDCFNPAFEFEPDCYRIKPEPKLRPYKCGEYNTGCPIVRHSKAGRHSWVWQVLAIQHDGFIIADYRGTRLLTWQELAERFEESTDHGATWKPCGVIE